MSCNKVMPLDNQNMSSINFDLSMSDGLDDLKHFDLDKLYEPVEDHLASEDKDEDSEMEEIEDEPLEIVKDLPALSSEAQEEVKRRRRTTLNYWLSSDLGENEEPMNNTMVQGSIKDDAPLLSQYLKSAIVE